jgi:hypothetical protein
MFERHPELKKVAEQFQIFTPRPGRETRDEQDE